MPCAASPPSTFCQEKVVTSSLSQGRSCAKAAEVASQSVRPPRSAGITSPEGHAHARGRAVPGEADVVIEIQGPEIHDRAVTGLVHACLDGQLLHGIGHPSGAEAFPCDHLHRALAQHGPHRHLVGAGVRSGHDADAVVGGNAEKRAGILDGLPELRLSDAGAVRAAERRLRKPVEGEARDLGAGAGGKTRVFRPRRRFVGAHAGLTFQIDAPRWGGVSHGRGYVRDTRPARRIRRTKCRKRAMVASRWRGSETLRCSGGSAPGLRPPPGYFAQEEGQSRISPPSTKSAARRAYAARDRPLPGLCHM